MNNLKMYNSQVLTKICDITFAKPTSAPLLVSSNKKYISLIRSSEESILYIGQETNTWLYSGATQEEIENAYYQFLTQQHGTNRPFWKFIKEMIGQDEELGKKVIWANALLVGRQDKKGAIEDSDKIIECSVSYLEYLYHYFHPQKVVIVCGSNNPYYEVIHEFLTRIGYHDFPYPTTEQPVVYDKQHHIYWTYHPKYLNMIHQFQDVNEIIKSHISKKR